MSAKRWGPAVTVEGGPSTQTAASQGPVRLGARQEGPAPIAIVGVGCALPGALDVQAFWSNLVRGIDAIDPRSSSL